jgi:hypothetical protein
MIKANITLCYDYSVYSALDEPFQECKNECELPDKDNCCLRVCLLKKMETLKFSTDPNLKPEFVPEGIAKGFLVFLEDYMVMS